MYYALSELALHPDVQEELYREVQTVCGDEPPRYHDLINLIYTQCIMYETMRLHPIIGSLWLTVAGANDETILDGKYPIPKTSTVGMDFYNVHRNEKYWGPDADKFVPSRFDNRKASPGSNEYCPDGRFRMPVRDAFFGFGDGPRTCLGMTN